MAWRLLLSSSCPLVNNSTLKPFPLLPAPPQIPNFSCKPNNAQFHSTNNNNSGMPFSNGRRPLVPRAPTRCQAQNNNSNSGGVSEEERAQLVTRIQQAVLWAAEAAYILWLFLLPYAPV